MIRGLAPRFNGEDPQIKMGRAILLRYYMSYDSAPCTVNVNLFRFLIQIMDVFHQHFSFIELVGSFNSSWLMVLGSWPMAHGLLCNCGESY